MDLGFISQNILQGVYQTQGQIQKHLLKILVHLVANLAEGQWPELLP